jgi:hypothetical protein
LNGWFKKCLIFTDHYFNLDPRIMFEDLDVALTDFSIPIPVSIDRAAILGK